jgi:pre-rRNA-processing protein TSR1
VPKGIRWREARGRVLAENVTWEENAEGEDGEGTLVVEGVVRGGRLDANRLVHLQNFGDFKIERVCSC